MSLYATKMELDVQSARVRVRTRFWGEGSVLAETVSTRCTGVSIDLKIESTEPAERIAKLARVAEQGCYVIQSLRRPTEVECSVSHNGEKIDLL